MSASPGLATHRREAEERFAVAGVPHRRIEAWHYTDLRNAIDADMPAAAPYRGALLRRADFAVPEADTLVIVNGVYRPDLSHPPADPAIEIAFLDADAPDWARAALNPVTEAATPMADLALARAAGGVAIRVSHNFKASRPLHLAFVGRGETEAARHAVAVLALGTDAALTLVETHEAEGAAGLSNTALHVALKANARLAHLKIADGVPGEAQIGTVLADIHAGALYDVTVVPGDPALARHEIHARLAQRMAGLRVTGLTLLNGRQHADITVAAEHAMREGKSDLAFKAVLADKARGVSQGRILVRPGADGTDSRQSTRALLLGKGAEADAKPELEIHAEDVVCGHGAAIGDLDADALFYLRARGIPEREARAMLTEAFMEEGLARLPEGEAADLVRRFVLARLHGLEAA